MIAMNHMALQRRNHITVPVWNVMETALVLCVIADTVPTVGTDNVLSACNMITSLYANSCFLWLGIEHMFDFWICLQEWKKSSTSVSCTTLVKLYVSKCKVMCLYNMFNLDNYLWSRYMLWVCSGYNISSHILFTWINWIMTAELHERTSSRLHAKWGPDINKETSTWLVELYLHVSQKVQPSF